MQRFRGRDIGLGLLVILVNVALVVGVVTMTTGGPGSSAAPTPSPSASATVSTPASPSATSAPTATPSPTPSPSGSVPDLLASDEAVEIGVLGDQTCDGPSEWVAVLAGLLASERTVLLHRPDPQDPTVYSGAQELGTSGAQTDVYNACRAGTEASYAVERLGVLVPEDPDLVLLDYGRNDSPDSVVEGYDGILDEIRDRWPEATVLVVLQPPTFGDGQADVREETRSWAEVEDLEVLDVAAEFVATGAPDSYVSPFDPTATSAAGDQLWGETVHALLTDGPLPVTG